MPKITFAVSGPAPSSPQNTERLLNDWLGLGPADDTGTYTLLADREDPVIHVILPITAELLTPGVQSVLDWTAPACAPWTAIAQQQPLEQPHVAAALGKCFEVVDGDGNVPSVLLAELAQAQHNRGPHDKVALLVLFNQYEPDPDTVQLMQRAELCDIPVYNLAYGLAPDKGSNYTLALPWTPHPYADAAAEPELAAVFPKRVQEPEEAAGQLLRPDVQDPVMTVETAREALAQISLPQIEELRDLLLNVAAAQGEMNKRIDAGFRALIEAAAPPQRPAAGERDPDVPGVEQQPAQDSPPEETTWTPSLAMVDHSALAQATPAILEAAQEVAKPRRPRGRPRKTTSAAA